MNDASVDALEDGELEEAAAAGGQVNGPRTEDYRESDQVRAL